MPTLQDCSMGRSQQRVAGTFAVALWLLGTAQCFLAPPLAPGLRGISGASRITGSRSRLLSWSTCVRQSGRGEFSLREYCCAILVVSPTYCFVRVEYCVASLLSAVVEISNPTHALDVAVAVLTVCVSASSELQQSGPGYSAPCRPSCEGVLPQWFVLLGRI